MGNGHIKLSCGGDILQDIFIIQKGNKVFLKYSINYSEDLKTLKDEDTLCFLFSRKLPLYIAYELESEYRKYVCSFIFIVGEKILSDKNSAKRRLKYIIRLIKRLCRAHGLRGMDKAFFRLVDINQLNEEIDIEDVDVLKHFRGRILAEEEFLKQMKTLDITRDEATRFVWRMNASGKCEIQPAISIDLLHRECTRCKAKSNFIAHRCTKCDSTECLICTECRSLGMVSSCEEIYIFFDDTPTLRLPLVEKDYEPRYMYPMTKTQLEVSISLEKWMSTEDKEALIWAVCGAGKTEVSFAAISLALSAAGKVMLAVPRRDIAKELGERLSYAFKGIQVSCLYGNSDRKYHYEDRLVVCTTHQAIRFYKAFDLIVVDEVDAYPYKGSEMLHTAVKRAAKDESKFILMTATPPKALKDRVASRDLPCFRISARHHGKPLPLPEIVICREEIHQDRLPFSIAEIIFTATEDNHRVFVFVPKRKMAKDICDILQRTQKDFGYGDLVIEYSTSTDIQRNEKMKSFREEGVDIFVVTTILERGITIDKSNVVVLNADDERIFDDNTLVQMAGRAGRTTKNPQGKVWFVCKKDNVHIRDAVNQIKDMNDYALEKGYIS